jgi:hypothetical protein
MHLLRHSDVDGYPSTRGKFPDMPTKEQLVHVLSAYYDVEKCNTIAEELIASGECCVDDSSCTTFALEKV